MDTLLSTLLLGIDWLDPEWLLHEFGAEFLWVSLLIVFVECGLFFPFLPGDTLLFALGIFVATGQVDLFPGDPLVELGVVMVLLVVAGFLGNVTGYEIGRWIGPPLYAREGRVLKRHYFDQTEAFFDRHGNKALVIGRFVAFVRTYITVVAGVTHMDRRRFFVWSFLGALLWVLSITLLGYFLGQSVPWLGDNISAVILAIIVVGTVPMVWEWYRHRHTPHRTDTGGHEEAPRVTESPSQEPPDLPGGP